MEKGIVIKFLLGLQAMLLAIVAFFAMQTFYEFKEMQKSVLAYTVQIEINKERIAENKKLLEFLSYSPNSCKFGNCIKK